MRILVLLLVVATATAVAALEHDLPLNRHSYICVACAPLGNFAACIAECACGWCQNATDARVGVCIDADLGDASGVARPAACAAGLWHSDAAQARCDVYPASLVAGLAAGLAATLTLLAAIALVKCVARCRRMRQ
jgi:hypothetical protein